MSRFLTVLLPTLAVTLAGCGPSGTPGTPGTTGPAVSESASGMAWPGPERSDVATLDGILAAYYEVVSGPAGETRNWDRDKSLHIPNAQVVITRDGDDGTMRIDRMTISEYHERQPALAAEAFYEYEIHRVVQNHGSTVHVWSTYEHASAPGGEADGRGVNSIELVWDGSRYWITSWSYDGRADAPPVPSEYLPE